MHVRVISSKESLSSSKHLKFEKRAQISIYSPKRQFHLKSVNLFNHKIMFQNVQTNKLFFKVFRLSLVLKFVRSFSPPGTVS